MLRYSYILLSFIGLSLLFSSCSSDDGDSTPDPTRVLLVYVGTDSNLSGYEQAKLAGLRNGWTGRSTDRIIAYIDDLSGDARLIEVSNLKPGEQPRKIETYGRENSASADVFGRVVADVLHDYPADSYGLLIFSHGSGWLPEGVFNSVSKGVIPATAGGSRSSRSIIIDGTSEMELSDFASAIPDGVFDYIAFEACFMSCVEVAYELRNKAPLILASSAEIVDPGFAPVYAGSTAKLLGGNIAGFGRDVFAYTLTYSETSVRRSATYSVINTAGLEPLADFLGRNCDFSTQVDAATLQHFDRNAYHLFFDFEDYYGRLLATDAQRAELARLVANCIVWKDSTRQFMTQQSGYSGFVINKHSGLTTYVPQALFGSINAAHAQTSWAQAVTQ